jgi:hypothetical protein
MSLAQRRREAAGLARLGDGRRVGARARCRRLAAEPQRIAQPVSQLGAQRRVIAHGLDQPIGGGAGSLVVAGLGHRGAT